MKIILFLTSIFAFTIHASVFPQETQMSFEVKGQTIRQIIQDIETRSEYRFFYNDQLANLDDRVDFRAENITEFEAIKQLCEGQELIFKLMENNLVLIMPTSIAQQKIINGMVTDENGEPLPGLSIIIKGTTRGTVTNLEGEYTIEVEDPSAVLEFLFVGYITQEVAVGDQTVININMEQDIFGLEEVVVIGYGVQRKTEVTGAVGSAKSEDFIKGNVGDAGQLIRGKIAGLTVVTHSGDPTSTSQILLRGISTLKTSTQPLILVDGIPGNLNTLAQDDIESIDVLKDGSAAAIYGTRGTNGVILITSKKIRGKIEPTINYYGYISMEQWVNVPRMLNAQEYRDRIAGGTAFADLGSDTDWIKEISNKTPISHYHNFSLNGGNTKTNYMASLNYRESPGMLINYDYKILNSRIDINHSMFDDKLILNANFISNDNRRNVDFDQMGQALSDSPDNGIFGQALWRNPTAPIKNEDGTWNEEPSISYYENPLGILHETYGGFESISIRLSGSVTWKPIKGLSLKALYSRIKYNDQRSQGQTKNHLSSVKDGLNGYASKSSSQSIDGLLELTADYRISIYDSHVIRALVGYSYQDNIWESDFMRNWDFPAGNFSYPDNIGVGQKYGTGGPNLMNSSKYASNLIGFFGRVNYNYKDKYLIMASLRYEGSSKFIGTDQPWGTFPAVSAGWRIHEEDFLKESAFFDQLKLRIGYGVTGTAPDEYFLGVAMLGYSGSFLINGKWVPSLTPTRNPNPALRWEEKKETNIGLDFGILKNRISGTIDLYDRTTDGLLYDYTVPTPPNTYRTTTANVGVMKNSGIEFLLNVIPVQTQKLVWNSTASFSTNTNKLVSLSNDLYETTNPWFNAGHTGSPVQTYTHRVEEGKEIGNFYGYKVIDISEDGYWIYEDMDGGPSSTRAEEDKKILGNGLPKYYATWNNTITYGNFDLTVTMRGAFGFQLLNFQRMYSENPGFTSYNQLLSSNDKIFGKAVLNSSVPVEYNSYYVENGDYWKIDNIQLGYSFPVSNINHIKRAYLYISTLNTLIITNYKGMDPEVNRIGLNPGNDERYKFPSTRVYSLGINISFN